MTEVRYCTRCGRTFGKCCHTFSIELPFPVTKEQCIQFLIDAGMRDWLTPEAIAMVEPIKPPEERMREALRGVQAVIRRMNEDTLSPSVLAGLESMEKCFRSVKDLL